MQKRKRACLRSVVAASRVLDVKIPTLVGLAQDFIFEIIKLNEIRILCIHSKINLQNMTISPANTSFIIGCMLFLSFVSAKESAVRGLVCATRCILCRIIA